MDFFALLAERASFKIASASSLNQA